MLPIVAARVEVGAERPWLWSRFQLQHKKCVAYHEHIHIYHLLQETNKGLHVLMQYPQCICLMRNIRVNKFENIINMFMSPSTIFSSSTVYSCMMLEDSPPGPRSPWVSRTNRLLTQSSAIRSGPPVAS